MASTSSSHQEIVKYQEKRVRSTASSKLYDVFISHRGPDVKEEFAIPLYKHLEARECRAFVDRLELEKGDSITPAIQSAIQSSVVQIAIFSKGYAHSSWCLDELVLMLHQRDHEGARFIPVFYDVEPFVLRYIKGPYAEAFCEYEVKGRNLDKLEGWRKALQTASHVIGFELSSSKSNLCEEGVSCVEKEIEKRKPLHVAPYPVGLGELVGDFERRFEGAVNERVNIVGIFGQGGSGKTTMAKEVFNRKRLHYDASCFLHDVRESHAKCELHVLQKKLLKDLFNKEEKFRHTDEGTQLLKDGLKRAGSHKRFLIILDDIDHHDQLYCLLFQDLLSPTSFVIVTTRDKGVLIAAEISNCYQMKTMDSYRARQLFLCHAFGGKEPTFQCEQLVERFVEFCCGLPLSLKVLGTHVRGRDENYWKLELEKVRDIQPIDVTQCLKISFDSLEWEEKEIFMDIACFFIGHKKDRVVEIWKSTQWTAAEHAVQRLLDKCFIEIDVKRDEFLWRYHHKWEPEFRMHDHLRDFGRQMADKKVPRRLWRPEHLRSMREKGFQKILEESNGRCYDKFNDSSLDFEIEYLIGNANNYAGTSNALLWLGPVRVIIGKIPSWFPVRQLRDLSANCVDISWSILPARMNMQDTFQFRRLELIACRGLQNLPDIIKISYHLEELIIFCCPGLQTGIEGTALLKSLANLRNFKTLDISYVPVNGELVLANLSNLENLVLWDMPINGELCLSNIRGLTHSSCMSGLRKLTFHHQHFPKLVISGKICPSLEYLEISSSFQLTEVDLKLVKTFKVLSLDYCGDLKIISGLSGVTSLEELSIRECPELENIEGAQELKGMKFLVIFRLCGHVCQLNFLSRLERLPADRITITAETGEGVHESVRRLNLNLFSDVVGGHAITEIESRRHYRQKLEEIRTSSTAIVIVTIVRSGQVIESPESAKPPIFYGGREVQQAEILKGFMAKVNGDEEWKALYLLKEIIGRLYLPSVFGKPLIFVDFSE